MPDDTLIPDEYLTEPALDEYLIPIRTEPNGLGLALARCGRAGAEGHDLIGIVFSTVGLHAMLPNMSPEEVRIIGALLLSYADRVARREAIPCPDGQLGPPRFIQQIETSTGPKLANMEHCTRCGSIDWTIFRIIGQAHQHHQCVHCHACYCIDGRCGPPDDAGRPEAMN